MPRRCTVCTHPERERIEKDLVTGGSIRNIAKRFGLSPASVHRHKADHLPASLIEANKAGDVARADCVLEEIRAEIRRIQRLYKKAEAILDRAQNQPIALKSVRELSRLHKEMRETLELLARISGEFEQQQAGRTAVLIVPEQLPPGAPCHLDKEYWIRRGFLGPGKTAIPEGANVIEVQAEPAETE